MIILIILQRAKKKAVEHEGDNWYAGIGPQILRKTT